MVGEKDETLHKPFRNRGGESRFAAEPTRPSHAEQINQVLFAIADAVNTTEDLGELYRRLHHILGSIIDVTNFFIAIIDHQQRTIHFPYYIDTVDKIYPSITDFDISSSLTGLLIEERKPALLRREVLQERAQRQGLQGTCPLIWMGSPLLIRDEAIGVVAVQSYTDADIFDETDLEILTAVSHQIAVAIDRRGFLDKLQRSEEQYRQLVESANNIILRVDSLGRITFCNEFALRFFGYQAEELIGRSMIGTLLPSGRHGEADFLALLAEVGRRPEPHATTESIHLRRDGTRLWISWTNKPFYNNAGILIDLLRIGSDITERKQMEKALRDKSAELERYFSLSLDLLCIADTKGYFVKLNPEWHRLLGYPAGELEGRSFLDLVHPDDLRATIAALTRLDKQHDVLNFENRYRCHDGRYRWIEWRSRAKKGLIYAAARDITHRKEAEEVLRQSEETFRNIVLASPMGMHLDQLQDHDQLVFTGANPAADRMLGVDNSKFIGMTLEEAFPPLVDTEIPTRYRRAARFGENWRTEQIDYRHGAISGAFEVYVFQMAQGKAAVLFNDITARKQAESEKAKLQLQLTQAQKMESVGRLAGGVAHDFNNMLGVILGHSEMALSRLQPGQGLYTTFDEIREAARRSAELTKQLLAFARQQTVAPRILDLNETVAGMLTMLRRLIGENINLAWRPGKNLGTVRIDPSQLDQILINLCVNARAAISDTGKITIETSLVTLDEAYCQHHPGFVAGSYVLLAVSDNGCGMDSPTKAHLFEPFFTTKEVGKGTGLGLATIYGIVKQNSGFINVYSEPDQGSTFSIYLPQHADSAIDTAKGKTEHWEARGNESILLVEDEPMILAMTRTMLELLG